MIEPKSTDVGREVLYKSRYVRGPVVAFTHIDVEVRLNSLPVLLKREDLVWADLTSALEYFGSAGLEVEEIGDDLLRVAGCLYWVKTGMFERPDGTKGSGGPGALVRFIAGVPEVPPTASRGS